MLENKTVIEEYNYDVDFDEYDRRMNALAERDDERWEDCE